MARPVLLPALAVAAVLAAAPLTAGAAWLLFAAFGAMPLGFWAFLLLTLPVDLLAARKVWRDVRRVMS